MNAGELLQAIGAVIGLRPAPAALQLAPPDRQFEVLIPPEMREGMTYGGMIAPRISREQALQVPAVLRCRNLIAGTLATLPVHIHQDRDRREAEPTSLLEQIDPDQANVVTMADTYEDLFFEGTAWWRIEAFGWHEYPIYAKRVDPRKVSISSDGTVRIDGRAVPDRELIRFDSPNPPLLKHAARAIRTCLQLDDAAARYANEPAALGYLTPKEGAQDPTPGEVEEIMDTFTDGMKQRAWSYVSGGLEPHQLAWNAQQIQLAEQRQHAVLEIARAAGVDPEDLGVSTTSRTYQNAEQRRLDVLDFTLRAYVAAVEQRLSMRDVLPRGYSAKVNLDAFLRSDTKTRMETYQIGRQVGAYTQEEVRALEDRPSLTPAEAAAVPGQGTAGPANRAAEARVPQEATP